MKGVGSHGPNYSSKMMQTHYITVLLPYDAGKLTVHILLLLLFFFNKFYLFIYLFLAELHLRCCMWAFSSCGERSLLSVAVHGLLTAVASLVVEHGL